MITKLLKKKLRKSGLLDSPFKIKNYQGTHLYDEVKIIDAGVALPTVQSPVTILKKDNKN